MRYRGTFNYYNPIVAQENSVGRIVFLTELSFFLARCVQNACEQGNRGCYAGFLVGKQGRGQRDASTRQGLERVTRESCRHALTSHAPPRPFCNMTLRCTVRVNSDSSAHSLGRPQGPAFQVGPRVSTSQHDTSHRFLPSVSIPFPPLETRSPICLSASFPLKIPAWNHSIYLRLIGHFLLKDHRSQFSASFSFPIPLADTIFESVESFKK